MTTKWLSAATAGMILLSVGLIFAQNSVAPLTHNSTSAESYDVGREQILVGTVLSYSAASHSAPWGPRLTLQTQTDVVDIHLGDARTLSTNHFTIQTGDALRVIGEAVNLPNNTTQFLARILQKGTQAIVLRTPHGFPIPPSVPADAKDGKKQAGAM